MTAAEVGGYLISGIIGALISAAIFSIALVSRVVKVESSVAASNTVVGTQMGHVTQRIDVLDKHLTALLSSLGVLLRDDILQRMREADESRHNR